MPGILPMKVIKIGTNAQTRIAQACDRCRSKKIRCDGIRPCCTQCANVGFECKTSDKLSRRAFPRGYTESLEERVRALESEVRELKELLDEKDEKIDLLSKIHSQSSHPLHQPPRRASELSEGSSKDETPIEPDESDETFRVRQSPCVAGSEPYFAGTSSTRNFIDAFQQRLKELDQAHELYINDLLPPARRNSSDATISPVVWSPPPRLVSDQLVNIYFQEWAPLFPVVHRPTFLTTYQKYVANSDEATGKTSVAHLNLIFSIAALSKGTSSEELEVFESQWKAAIDMIMNENTLETLQALVLAQIYCLAKGDLSQLLTYKGLATTLSARLGLHRTQRPFELGPLKSETRKKLFWTLYTVDCFSSVALGLPKHIKDEDVHCELPQDVDDEYLSESGFQPVLPGEYTKLSSALALFKAASILSRVLEEVFPAKVSYELSLKKLSDLSDELEFWEASLPSHLRLHFAQDKPSTGTITSRSPILSLAYHYIRALIQRPAITASLGSKSSSVMMIHADSCKRMVQIIQLLDERGLSFSFCFNKDEVLVLASIGLLFHRLQLDPASKILKDNERTLRSIIEMLARTNSPIGNSLQNLIKTIVPSFDIECAKIERPHHTSKPSISRCSSGRVTPSEYSNTQPSTRKQLKAIASRFTAPNGKVPSLNTSREFTPSNAISLQPRASLDRSHLSLSPVFSTHAESEGSTSPVSTRSHPLDSGPSINRHSFDLNKRSTMPLLNLDYLSFGNEPEQTSRSDSTASQPIKTEPGPTDWEKLLGSLDNGATNIFDASYGGAPIEALAESPPYRTEPPTSLAIQDAALTIDNGVFSPSELNGTAIAMSGKTSPDIASSLSSTSSDEALLDVNRSFSTDASSAASNVKEKDLLGALLLSDFEADFEFDFDLDPNWQEILTAGV